MKNNETGRTSILATNELMDCMGVSYEQLKTDALKNAPKNRPVVIQDVYHYDAKAHIFELVEKFEARLQEKML